MTIDRKFYENELDDALWIIVDDRRQRNVHGDWSDLITCERHPIIKRLFLIEWKCLVGFNERPCIMRWECDPRYQIFAFVKLEPKWSTKKNKHRTN